MTKLVKEELLNEVYDLVLSVDIKDEERQALLTFKNAVEAGQDFDRAVMSLASDLRRIGVANIAKKTKMSASVNTFYQKIATYGEFEKNLGVVVAGLCGLADACDLFVDLRCAPRRGVFFQMVGVFHTIVFFTKLEKLFDPASFPDQLF